MKNLFFCTLAIALLAVCAAPVYAQSTAFRADVPFAFTVGNTVLPAGQYQFSVEPRQTLTRIVPVDSRKVSFAMLSAGEYRSAATLEKGLLRFEKYGQHYILSAIWGAGSQAGNRVVGAKRPVEYTKADGVTDVTTR